VWRVEQEGGGGQGEAAGALVRWRERIQHQQAIRRLEAYFGSINQLTAEALLGV
jgi:hypothetical protein